MERLAKSVIVFVVLASVSPLLGEANTRRDGNYWNSLSRASKLDYIAGFFDGMDLGNDFSFWGDTYDKNGHMSVCATKAVESYGEFVGKYMANVTNSQISDGLDEFYKDFRNRKIRVQEGVWIVLKEISGAPKDDIDNLIDKHRGRTD